jgi:hypothetical protein
MLVAAVADLWRVPPPGPDNLLAAPRFIALRDLCAKRFGGSKAPFALSSALRALGMPCHLPKNRLELKLDPSTAAARIEAAFCQETTVRRHLCPLDLADDLPPITFGSARLANFTAGELEALFDAPRLARTYPKIPLEADRLAQFHWLVVEETLPVRTDAEARAAPWMFDIIQDFGAIEPHQGRFPEAVEAALFHLLLAPWEDWSTITELDWRGFHVPWIYTISDDLFVQPKRPPSPNDLSLEPWIVTDSWGDEVELERPATYPLNESAGTALACCSATTWDQLQAARATSLFETPVVHFLVRAFLADGIDEFMAHMTTIEAALGLELDHRRPRRSPHPNVTAARRVGARIAAALGDPNAAKQYLELFELRSAFVHGRGGMKAIPSAQRVMARSLARRAAGSLVALAAPPARTRVELLTDLLNKGVPMLPPS